MKIININGFEFNAWSQSSLFPLLTKFWLVIKVSRGDRIRTSREIFHYVTYLPWFWAPSKKLKKWKFIVIWIQSKPQAINAELQSPIQTLSKLLKIIVHLIVWLRKYDIKKSHARNVPIVNVTKTQLQIKQHIYDSYTTNRYCINHSPGLDSHFSAFAIITAQCALLLHAIFNNMMSAQHRSG